MDATRNPRADRTAHACHRCGAGLSLRREGLSGVTMEHGGGCVPCAVPVVACVRGRVLECRAVSLSGAPVSLTARDSASRLRPASALVCSAPRSGLWSLDGARG